MKNTAACLIIHRHVRVTQGKHCGYRNNSYNRPVGSPSFSRRASFIGVVDHVDDGRVTCKHHRKHHSIKVESTRSSADRTAAGGPILAKLASSLCTNNGRLSFTAPLRLAPITAFAEVPFGFPAPGHRQSNVRNVRKGKGGRADHPATTRPKLSRDLARSREDTRG